MPRAFLVKKSSSINSSISLSLPNHKAGYPDKKTTAADGQKQGDLPWESLDMSEYEKELQTAQTVELELDYQRYTNRRTPSPQGEVSRQGITLKAKKYLSADSEETDRRIPLFYSPSSKSNFHEVSYTEEDVEKPFECRHCIISFARLNDLQSHMELHSIKKPFNCTDMRRTFDERLIENQLITNHSIKMMHRPSTSDFKFHSPEKPFKCENEIDKIAMDNPDHFIEKPFDFNRRMFFPRTNSDLQHNSYPRTYANYFEERETRTQADSEKEISTEKPFKCRECDISFGQVNDLQRHYETHSCKKSPTNDIDIDVTSDMESVTSEESQNEKPFKCNHCVMSFTRPSDLQRHLLIHSNNKPYRCEKCDREFTWFGNFQKHILSHMSDNQSQSAGSYSAMFTLLAREQVKDLFIKEGDKYRCRLCSKDFTRLSGLKTHIRMHTGERPYVCEVCSFAFTTSRALKMHTRLHTGEKPYKCDVCDRAFTRRDEMHTHMYIHKGEKPFKCTECSASFIRYGHLQRHLLIHSDDKPYKCKLCPKSFTQYRNLQTHTYKHTGERPYKCKYCPKGFTQYGTLQAHERTHTGEKPFKCQLCEKAFITSSHLRWHIKTQHPKNQSE